MFFINSGPDVSINLVSLLLLLIPLNESRGQPPPQEGPAEVQSIIRQIYLEVSCEKQQEVNWGKVRSFFDDDAIMVLRTSRDATTHFTVEGFIQDFRDFYQTPRVREYGFKEEILTMDSRIFHEMAYVAVVYSASITDGTGPSQKGVDFWLLTRTDQHWKVVAVTNEVIAPDRDIPEWIDLSE